MKSVRGKVWYIQYIMLLFQGSTDPPVTSLLLLWVEWLHFNVELRWTCKLRTFTTEELFNQRWTFSILYNNSHLLQVVCYTYCHQLIFLNSFKLISVFSALQAFVPRVLGMYFIAALALIFYVSKVPERYFPGETTSRSALLDTLLFFTCNLEKFTASCVFSWT